MHDRITEPVDHVYCYTLTACGDAGIEHNVFRYRTSGGRDDDTKAFEMLLESLRAAMYGMQIGEINSFTIVPHRPDRTDRSYNA